MIDADAIRAGLNGGEFFVEYLPTIDLDSGRCVGAEALSRWRRDSGAVVNPFEVADLTQDIALSGRIAYWVIETVARELGDWLRAHRDVHIAINVPPEIMGRGGLEHAVANAGLMDVLDRIIVEITERGVPDAIGVDALNRMRAVGVRVALDDVGVSDANLVVLSRVNVDIIKLPKTFVDCLLDEASASQQLAGLRALMHATDIQVIAEGVETERQVEILKAAGVKMIQGWYFSPALPAEEFKAFFAAHQ
jgi:sensor c-di-GMP phosphodiesterase-like protein